MVIGDIARDAANSGVTFRQGAVVSWNPPTSTVIRVGRVEMTDLPRLSTVTDLVAGDTVALLRCAGSLLVIGKIVRP